MGVRWRACGRDVAAASRERRGLWGEDNRPDSAGGVAQAGMGVLDTEVLSRQ